MKYIVILSSLLFFSSSSFATAENCLGSLQTIFRELQNRPELNLNTEQEVDQLILEFRRMGVQVSQFERSSMIAGKELSGMFDSNIIYLAFARELQSQGVRLGDLQETASFIHHMEPQALIEMIDAVTRRIVDGLDDGLVLDDITQLRERASRYGIGVNEFANFVRNWRNNFDGHIHHVRMALFFIVRNDSEQFGRRVRSQLHWRRRLAEYFGRNRDLSPPPRPQHSGLRDFDTFQEWLSFGRDTYVTESLMNYYQSISITGRELFIRERGIFFNEQQLNQILNHELSRQLSSSTRHYLDHLLGNLREHYDLKRNVNGLRNTMMNIQVRINLLQSYVETLSRRAGDLNEWLQVIREVRPLNIHNVHIIRTFTDVFARRENSLTASEFEAISIEMINAVKGKNNVWLIDEVLKLILSRHGHIMGNLSREQQHNIQSAALELINEVHNAEMINILESKVLDTKNWRSVRENPDRIEDLAHLRQELIRTRESITSSEAELQNTRYMQEAREAIERLNQREELDNANVPRVRVGLETDEDMATYEVELEDFDRRLQERQEVR